MRISVTFRHLDSSEALKDYVAQKLSKVNKYFDGPIDANVVLSVEKFRQIAEFTVTSGKFTVNCQEQTDDMYHSIDKAVDKVERRVKRQREKIRKKTSDQDKMSFINSGGGFGDPDWANRIVETHETDPEPMSVEEATAKLDENLNDDFLVFTNATTQKINVLYRLKDGNFRLIET